jgi:membrane-bound metal-dependent hydrolase YbcI (DUF457 family)
MWPWGHLAFGYLLYSIGRRIGRRPRPDSHSVLSLVLGTQLPDLIDKPLAWWVPILPGGRTLGHSLVFAVPLVVVLAVLARRRRAGRLVVAFAVGYASHLVGDLLEPLAVGNYWELNILLWPLTPTVLYDSEPSLLWHLANITPSPVFLAEAGLGAFVVALWIADGAPILREFLGLFRRPITPDKQD